MSDTPASQLVAQRLVLIGGYPDGVWSCAWCAAELIAGVITHRPGCTWLAEVVAGAVAADRERCAELVSREAGIYEGDAASILYDMAELLRQEPGPGEAGHPGPQASSEGKGAP